MAYRPTPDSLRKNRYEFFFSANKPCSPNDNSWKIRRTHRCIDVEYRWIFCQSTCVFGMGPQFARPVTRILEDAFRRNRAHTVRPRNPLGLAIDTFVHLLRPDEPDLPELYVTRRSFCCHLATKYRTRLGISRWYPVVTRKGCQIRLAHAGIRRSGNDHHPGI